MTKEWIWWVGHSEEYYSTQCDTRDEAVQIALEEYGDGAWIVEAQGPANLNLSDYFESAYFTEIAEGRAYDDHANEESCDAIFETTSEQDDDLQRSVRAAIDAWQVRHNLTFRGFKFQAMRNAEYIPAKEPTE